MNLCICFYLEKEMKESIPIKLLPFFMSFNNPQFVMMMQSFKFQGMGIIIDNHSETIDLAINNCINEKAKLKYTWCIIINMKESYVQNDYNFMENLIKFMQEIKPGKDNLVDFYSTAIEIFYAFSDRFNFMKSRVEKDIILG
jgi:hypothetical protein